MFARNLLHFVLMFMLFPFNLFLVVFLRPRGKLMPRLMSWLNLQPLLVLLFAVMIPLCLPQFLRLGRGIFLVLLDFI